MNLTGYCDVAPSFGIEDGENYQSVISEYATGSTNTDMEENTGMNKNAVEEFCSQDLYSQGFQEVDASNGETTGQPSFDLPSDDLIENGSMSNMLQDDNRNDSFSSESKRLKHDYQSSYPFEMQEQDNPSSHLHEMTATIVDDSYSLLKLMDSQKCNYQENDDEIQIESFEWSRNGLMGKEYDTFNRNANDTDSQQDDSSCYHLDTGDLTLDQSSDKMNDSFCSSTSIGNSESVCTTNSCYDFASGYPTITLDRSIAGFPTTSLDSSIASYPSVQRNESSSPVYGYGGEDSVDDSTNDIYTEGQEGLVAKDDDEQENYDNGRMIRQWTEQEMDLLEEGVKLYGTKNNWKKIAAHIGGRSASQCVNKWKNRRSEKWKKWNKDATKVLEELINRGLSFEEIQERMSGYTYIQIYQHHQKLTMNNGPWEDWEVKLLVYCKKHTNLSDTKIGKKLNNRHKDSVKCKWNEIKKKHQFN